MENWNEHQPERYSNFYGKYIKFIYRRSWSRAVEVGPGPAEVNGKVRVISPAPPRSSKVTESMYKYLQTL